MFVNKWFIIFVSLFVLAAALYFANSYYTAQYDIQEQEERRLEDIAERKEHEYLISRLDNLSDEREAENLKQTKIILDNITRVVKYNQDLIKSLIENQNITFQLNDTGTGTISSFGLGKPKIIPSE
jgi:alpha-galactosidase/6-phospho-beta-glucosidase family protein